MVSLQELQRQREKEQRADRLRQSRQVGSELGKMSARRYSEAKKEQQKQVTYALRERWSQEQSSQLDQSDATSFEIERRRGEGMRNAAAFAEQRYEDALKENEAWQSEKRLEQQRLSVGLASDRLKKEEGELKGEALKARRAFAKQVEDERSRRAVLLHQKQHNKSIGINSSSAMNNITNLLGGKNGRNGAFSPRGGVGAGSVGGVTLHTKDHSKANAEEEAKKVAEERQRQLAKKQSTLSQRQEETKQRAIKAMEEERLAEEKIRIEKEQDAAFKAKMVEENFRNRKGANQNTIVDYQEQEARKATALNRKAHLDFEATFLQLSAWKDVMATHKAPEESGMAWEPTAGSAATVVGGDAEQLHHQQQDTEGSGGGGGDLSSSPVPTAWWDDEAPLSPTSFSPQSQGVTPRGASLLSIRLQAVPLQVTPAALLGEDKPPVSDELLTREAVDEPREAVETEEEAPKAECIHMPQPKLTSNPALMDQVEAILAAAGVDASQFPGLNAAEATRSVGGEYDVGNNDDFDDEADAEVSSEDTEDEFERVTTQQRLGLREQHEKYLGDLNQLRERIAASASGNLKPAATYVDPLLLPPLGTSSARPQPYYSSSSDTAGGGNQTVPALVAGGLPPSPTATQFDKQQYVRVNPRYQQVAQQVRSLYLEEEEENVVDTQEEQEEEMTKEDATGSPQLGYHAKHHVYFRTEEDGDNTVAGGAEQVDGDTTLSPMSTPDKGVSTAPRSGVRRLGGAAHGM